MSSRATLPFQSGWSCTSRDQHFGWIYCALSGAVYCNRHWLFVYLFVCLFVCMFVGPPYYRQRAVFASPLSAFYFIFTVLDVSFRRFKLSTNYSCLHLLQYIYQLWINGDIKQLILCWPGYITRQTSNCDGPMNSDVKVGSNERQLSAARAWSDHRAEPTQPHFLHATATNSFWTLSSLR